MVQFLRLGEIIGGLLAEWYCFYLELFWFMFSVPDFSRNGWNSRSLQSFQLPRLPQQTIQLVPFLQHRKLWWPP